MTLEQLAAPVLIATAGALVTYGMIKERITNLAKKIEEHSDKQDELAKEIAKAIQMQAETQKELAVISAKHEIRLENVERTNPQLAADMRIVAHMLQREKIANTTTANP